jgi:hypothetical protein
MQKTYKIKIGGDSKLLFKNIDEIFLPVSDLKTTGKWYKDVFQTEISDEENGSIRVIFADGAITFKESDETYSYPTNPFGICTYDCESTYKEFKLKNINVSELEDWKGMQTFDCFDTNEIPIGMVGWKEKGYKNQQFIRVNGYFHIVKNLSASRKWFEHLFDAEVQYDFSFETKEHGEVHAIGFKNYRLSLAEIPKAPSIQHIPFTVSTFNIEDAMKHFINNKVKVTEIEMENNFKRFNIVDPDGNQLGIVEGEVNKGIWK